jgi:hypothetical protein
MIIISLNVTCSSHHIAENCSFFKSDLKMKMNNFGSQPLWVPLIFQKTVKATTNPSNKTPLYFCAKGMYNLVTLADFDPLVFLLPKTFRSLVFLLPKTFRSLVVLHPKTFRSFSLFGFPSYFKKQ